MNRQLIEDSDLSAGEYDILARLSAAPERTLRMSQLAERALYSRSRLTRTVIRMETDGLVKRTPCPDDGRGVFCTLTDPGFSRLAEAAPGHVTEVRQMIFDVLDAGEIDQLGGLLIKIAQVLRHEEALSGRLVPDAEQ
jgi:DNA-binding MarR family transcriptional regulator